MLKAGWSVCMYSIHWGQSLDFKMLFGQSSPKWTVNIHYCCHTCVFYAIPRCPADYLCLGFVTTYINSARRSKCPALGHSYYASSVASQLFSIAKETKNFNELLYMYRLFQLLTLLLSIFLHIGMLSPKQQPHPAIDDVLHPFRGYILFEDSPGHISLYATINMWSNASQTTLASGLTKCI